MGRVDVDKMLAETDARQLAEFQAEEMLYPAGSEAEWERHGDLMTLLHNANARSPAKLKYYRHPKAIIDRAKGVKGPRKATAQNRVQTDAQMKAIFKRR